jgi:hypothetical protein
LAKISQITRCANSIVDFEKFPKLPYFEDPHFLTKVDQPFKGTHQIRAPLDLDFIVVEIRGLFVKPDTFGDFYPSPKTVPQKLSRILHSLRL